MSTDFPQIGDAGVQKSRIRVFPWCRRPIRGRSTPAARAVRTPLAAKVATIAPCMRALATLLPLLLTALGPALLSGCSTSRLTGERPTPVYQREAFASDETFSRLFDTAAPQSCEAARRALLSQGYVVTRADERQVVGSKRFQPEGEVHVELSFNIVCASEGERLSTLFVSAQQDKYVLKKNPNAASIGVSAVGSISVPLGSTEDSLVKVASETVPAGVFYDRFFALVQRMLKTQAEGG